MCKWSTKFRLAIKEGGYLPQKEHDLFKEVFLTYILRDWASLLHWCFLFLCCLWFAPKSPPSRNKASAAVVLCIALMLRRIPNPPNPLQFILFVSMNFFHYHKKITYPHSSSLLHPTNFCAHRSTIKNNKEKKKKGSILT